MKTQIQQMIMGLLIKQERIGKEINDLQRTKRGLNNQISELIQKLEND